MDATTDSAAPDPAAGPGAGSSGADARTAVDVGASRLLVGDVGTGDVVVLHPSLGRGTADFDHLVGALVEAGFRVVTIDPRGVAGSTGPLTDLTLDDLADDVVGVMDVLAIPAAFVVGHAFGNRVMRAVASRHPDRVRAIVLLGAGGRVRGEPEVHAAIERCFDETADEADRLAAIATGFFAPGNDPAVWLGGWYTDAKRAQQHAILTADLEHWWLAGAAPMLVVQGLQDRAAPPENGRSLLAERRAPTRLVELDGAGHALLPEQPVAVAAAVVGFLNERRAG